MKQYIISLSLLLLGSGCGAGDGVETDAPQEEYAKNISHLEIDGLAVLPDIEVIEGVTYIDDILVVNDEYGLPEDYNPGLEQEVIDAYSEMSEDGAEEGYEFVIVSDFRSYQQQKALYDDLVVNSGQERADEQSASPGHSEHQSGLAIDVGTVESASKAAVSFGDTNAYDWLKDAAHEYGFIVRYQEGKEDITGFMYEPWHLRYVGTEAAAHMYEQDLVLEEYLNID